ncbi:MAG: hypothetical protein L6Q97_26705, partial [Thermoanaerobaculia bacterium]|nr:hypothetical protein [Thermoanaerobaculia bacterium]
MKYKSSQYCPNCYYPLPYKAKFCAQCGQKANDGKITMAALFKQVWVKAFHLEGKLFRSLRDIFIPGKIAVEFFKGIQ